MPLFCISIGLCFGAEPIVGFEFTHHIRIIYNPISNQLYYAAKGMGSYLLSDLNLTLITNLDFTFGNGRKLSGSVAPLPLKFNTALVCTGTYEVLIKNMDLVVILSI
jgi:hypothetical protein